MPERDGDTDARGPKFDRVMRSLALIAPSVLCGAFTGQDAPAVALSESFPAGTRVPDQLFQVGPEQLVHFEFERRPGRRLVPRMLVYLGLIMEKHPDHRVEQHVVVLGDGHVTGYDDLTGKGFALDLRVTYLREEDPDRFLDHPVLAPLAVLGRGDPHIRAHALSRALALIAHHGGTQTADLLEAAGVMATIHLDGSTIDSAVKETRMSIESIASFYEGTELGQTLVRRGRDEGRVEGRVSMLTALLRGRFGERPEIELLARRLAAVDEASATGAVLAAGSLDELLLGSD